MPSCALFFSIYNCFDMYQFLPLLSRTSCNSIYSLILLLLLLSNTMCCIVQSFTNSLNAFHRPSRLTHTAPHDVSDRYDMDAKNDDDSCVRVWCICSLFTISPSISIRFDLFYMENTPTQFDSTGRLVMSIAVIFLYFLLNHNQICMYKKKKKKTFSWWTHLPCDVSVDRNEFRCLCSLFQKQYKIAVLNKRPEKLTLLCDRHQE